MKRSGSVTSRCLMYREKQSEYPHQLLLDKGDIRIIKYIFEFSSESSDRIESHRDSRVSHSQVEIASNDQTRQANSI